MGTVSLQMRPGTRRRKGTRQEQRGKACYNLKTQACPGLAGDSEKEEGSTAPEKSQRAGDGRKWHLYLRC